ncbi:hypothetical protein, partial [Thiobacillus sp. 63-78]|uniref:hypothetical protein n=1 Tax=Thiobacillus sp. 63-78 TaxID=1895859 RepID=UPI0025F34325
FDAIAARIHLSPNCQQRPVAGGRRPYHLNKPRLQTRSPSTARFCLLGRGLRANYRPTSSQIAQEMSNPPYRKRMYLVASNACLA